MDVQHGRLWDCLTLQKGRRISQHDFFGDPTGKTFAETNVRTPRRLDAPEAFSIQRVLFSFNNQAQDVDVFAIAEDCYFTLWMGQKMYLRMLLIHMDTRNNVTIAPFRVCDFCRTLYVNALTCPGCGASQFSLMDAGEGEMTGRQFLTTLSIPICILNQMSFYVQLEGHTGYVLQYPLKLWCHFEGLHARGVQ